MKVPGNLVLYGSLVSLTCVALAAVLLIQPGTESTSRLGLVFAVIGPALAAVIAAIKAGEAAANTNGSLDARMIDANLQANSARRASDIVPPEAAAVPSPSPVSPDK